MFKIGIDKHSTFPNVFIGNPETTSLQGNNTPPYFHPIIRHPHDLPHYLHESGDPEFNEVDSRLRGNDKREKGNDKKEENDEK